jgi:hypothetical protein
MADYNILQEYLIKLGFSTDTSAFYRFSHALREAESLIVGSYLSMAKKVLEFQVAGVGAFAAIGAAAVGIAEKTAMADQEYRLLALHLYTSLPVARELKIALDALGQPLENVMWDPELARHFRQLVEDQRILTKELGPNFEAQMLKIRDVRFEFSRFGVELKYLTMQVVQELAKAFGTTADDLLLRMRNFNDWFITNMPAIANWIAMNLKPILIDVWEVLKATGLVARDFAMAFTEIIGVLSGNKAIEGTTFSVQRLGLAIQTVAGFVKDLLVSLSRVEQAGAHIVAGLGYMKEDFLFSIKHPFAPVSQDTAWTSAKKEFGAASNLLDVATGYGTGANSLGMPQSTTAAIVAAAMRMGVPPELALAVADIESGFRQYDEQGNVLMSKTPGSHATGIFQLQPSTAREMGIDASLPLQNIQGGVGYLKKLLNQYGGNKELALEHYYGSRDAAANAAYAQRVMAKEGDEYHINVTVNARTNADPKEIADTVWKAMESRLKNRVQRNLAEAVTTGWAFGGGGG